MCSYGVDQAEQRDIDGKACLFVARFLESCTDPNVQTLLTFHPFIMTSRQSLMQNTYLTMFCRNGVEERKVQVPRTADLDGIRLARTYAN